MIMGMTIRRIVVRGKFPSVFSTIFLGGEAWNGVFLLSGDSAEAKMVENSMIKMEVQILMSRAEQNRTEQREKKGFW